MRLKKNGAIKRTCECKEGTHAGYSQYAQENFQQELKFA